MSSFIDLTSFVTSSICPALLITLFVAAFAVISRPADAQVVFAEQFEDIGAVEVGQQGPAELIQDGWIFRNQSDPISSTPAWQPNGGVGWPQDGSGYLSSSSAATGMFGAKLSAWAILPEIPDLTEGDLFSLWVLDGSKPGTDTYIDIRRSPSGGIDTGSGPFDVGDFTDVIFTGDLPLSGDGPFVYTQILESLQGPGRLAIRFHSPAISNFQSSAILHIDSLTIGEAPPPPCGLTMPAATELVVWDDAENTYTICQDLVIPPTATLHLEPGVTVAFEPGTQLYVDGTLTAAGTEEQPVVFAGDNVSGFIVTGSLVIDHAEIGATIQLNPEGEATILDSILSDEAWLGATHAKTALDMERCDVAALVFSGAGASHLFDVDFSNPDSSIKLGRISKVDAITSVAPIEYTLNGQTRLIENVAITGVDGPAIVIGTSQTGSADVLLDASNTLAGNQYPIFIRTGGLHPDSVVPASGNANNAVLAPLTLGSASDLRSQASLPDLGVPFHVSEDATFNGRVDIPPGTTFAVAPDASINFRQNNGWHPQVRGLPGEPIRFERLNPATPWAALSSTQGINLWEHLSIDGPGWGVSASQSDIHLRDCNITNCGIGIKPSGMGIVYGTGNTLENNNVAVEIDTSSGAWGTFSGIRMDGAERPNVLAGNILAAQNLPAPPSGHYVDDMHMENNWWGHPSGPFHETLNPNGQGDAMTWGVLYQPWETQLPDFTNHRPVVRLVTQLHPIAITGEKIFIEWDAFDDQGITGFDIQVRTPPTFTDPPGWETLAANLPPSTRQYELIVPDREPGAGKQVQFRILAHEATGQSGIEFFWLNIPDEPPPGTVEFYTDFSQEFLYDGSFTLCYTAMLTTGALPTLYIDLDGDLRTMREFGITAGVNQCTSGIDRMPMVSTDTARFAIRDQGHNNNDYWYFSDYFEIRPDARFADAAPTVTVESPQSGQSFAGNTIVPISWTASDDDFVREFRIQASFNGGNTYHTIADRITGDTTSYSWQLPSSTGVDDLRIRVIAIDKRFQNSSSVVAISVDPDGSSQPGDIDGDGTVGTSDLLQLLAAWGDCDNCPEDLDGDGAVNVTDLLMLLQNWG